jgi:hypothetical protein
MRIQSEYMSITNRWMISSSYDCQAQHQWPQRRCVSQSAQPWFDVLPGLSSALPGFWSALLGLSPTLPGAPRLVVSAPWHVASAPRCSEMQLKATASVQYTPGFGHPGILVRQLSDTPSGSQWPKYILLMFTGNCTCLIWIREISPAEPAGALPVMWHSRMRVLRNRRCNWKLTHFDRNLCDLVGAATDSLHILICWTCYHWHLLIRSLTHLLADQHL